MNPDPSIGERIRARRLIRGWSVRHAADRAGVSHATWSRIERGRQAADNRFVLADIAAALECSPADLAGVPVPVTDRAAMAAQVGVYALRQALVDADLTEPADMIRHTDRPDRADPPAPAGLAGPSGRADRAELAGLSGRSTPGIREL